MGFTTLDFSIFWERWGLRQEGILEEDGTRMRADRGKRISHRVLRELREMEKPQMNAKKRNRRWDADKH